MSIASSARVVVIGGGVGGASIAHHLAEMGETDVTLLERHELTSGSTFHSAGLVGQLRSSLPLTRMMMHSVETYRSLEARADELGTAPGWAEVGSLRIASSPDRMDELRRQQGWAESFGLPTTLLSPTECVERFPLMTIDGVEGGLWLPTDGQLDPSSLTRSFIASAKAAGVTVRTRCRVTGFGTRRGPAGPRVTRVETSTGPIDCELVVIACGMYTPDVAALAGIAIPIVPMSHQYLITRPIPGVGPDLPSMRDPDRLVYFRNQGGGFVAGGYERDPAPWSVHGVPPDFNDRLLDSDWDRFAPLMEAAVERVPALADAQVIQLLNGPEGFTPDGEWILGETEVHGLFVAAGFCAHGIAGAGGIGEVMAHWMVDGDPGTDTWRMDVRRFPAAYRSRRLATERTVEVYSTYYDMASPNSERLAGRPLRRSPAYDAVVSLGADLGEKAMWERANWFPANSDPSDEPLRPRGWTGVNWHPAIAAEARACRQRAALFDLSSFATVAVTGPDAADFLQHICVNDVAREVGSVVYTQMCNEAGGIECDVTLTRLGADEFHLVTGTAFGGHDLGWMRHQLDRLDHADGATPQVSLADSSSAWACLGLWGPRARDILQPLTTCPLAIESFPFLTARHLTIGDVPAVAIRVTFVGESGWELWCPAEFGAALFDQLWAAGQPAGMVAGGYRAIDALRLEKGYRVWSTDVNPTDTPYEAGLGFCVALGKDADFVGRTALEAQKASGVSRRLACLVLDDPLAVVVGSEAVRDEAGLICGRVTSGGQGFTDGVRSIAFAYLPTGLAAPGQKLMIDVGGTAVQAVVHRSPLWDPKGERVRA